MAESFQAACDEFGSPGFLRVGVVGEHELVGPHRSPGAGRPCGGEVVTVVAVEIGLLTPPFGIAVFVIKATLGNASPITLNDIFAGAAPFAVIMFLVLLAVIAFPQLATALL